MLHLSYEIYTILGMNLVDGELKTSLWLNGIGAESFDK